MTQGVGYTLECFDSSTSQGLFSYTPYYSYDVSLENFVMDQLIIGLFICFFILFSFLCDFVLIL